MHAAAMVQKMSTCEVCEKTFTFDANWERHKLTNKHKFCQVRADTLRTLPCAEGHEYELHNEEKL